MRHHLGALLLCWIVSATALRVLDGDTFIARLDIWIAQTATHSVRVLGVNTPERRGTTRPAGDAARAFTVAWLADRPVRVATCGLDHFGRVLGKVTRDGEDLAAALIAAGHGVRSP